MIKGKNAIARLIKVLAVLTFLIFAYDIIRAIFFFGEIRTVDLVGLIQTLFSYLIAAALAILVAVYFWSYKGLRGIKIYSALLAVIYAYFIFSLPFSIGDTINWTPGYLGFTIFILLLGLVLAIWTMTYFKKMSLIQQTTGEQKNQ